jgi:alkanesulfonate monooxygenase SsuD/methylene tetrahydromethanopterin reductase-like flavin-dependent oxidoreductase (luciferase family)
MNLAIGLPNAVAGVDLATIATWAQRAEDAGFSTVAAIDRPGYDPLLALTVAAAVTERVELLTTLVMGPERTTRLLASQAATLDDLSARRLTLSLELGSIAVAPIAMTPGRQLAMHRDALRGGPSVLFDGNPDAAARHADGLTLRAGAAHELADGADALRAAWERHGRAGTPRAVGYFHCTPEDPEALRDTVAAFELAGATDLVAVPTEAAIDQLDLLTVALAPALVG